MRYDLVVLALDVLGVSLPDPCTSEVLQELTELGATLGLVSDSPEATARTELGRAQHLFDAYECGGTPRDTAAKLRRIARRMAVRRDRTLLVTSAPDDVEAATRLGVSSAAACWFTEHRALLVAARPTHAVAELSELTVILSNRPILRLVPPVRE